LNSSPQENFQPAVRRLAVGPAGASFTIMAVVTGLGSQPGANVLAMMVVDAVSRIGAE
jgi:hypothetical protein